MRGVKTTMAATRHSSSNQRFSLHSRPQSYDPLLKILTIYENKMGRSTLASFPLCLHFPFLYLTFNPTAERWEALDLGGRCESSPPLAGQPVKISAIFQKSKNLKKEEKTSKKSERCESFSSIGRSGSQNISSFPEIKEMEKYQEEIQKKS